MIRLEKVSRRYGAHPAVRDLSFELRGGELTGFLGPNGAGKTTTMRMIAGSLAPTSGRVLLAGEDPLRAHPSIRNRLGYLPEHCPLYDDMTPLELLETAGRLRGMAGAEREAAIDRVVDHCGLQTVMGRIIGEISKGFRQRVGLALALLHDPEVLILDEPTTGLDPNQIREIQGLVTALGETRTVLLSTHLLYQVPEICDRVLVIHQGRLLFAGTPDELLARGGARGASLTTSLAPDATRAAIGALPLELEVTHRDSSGARHRYAITGRLDDEVTASIADAVHGAGGRLSALEITRPGLDDVFAELTRAESL